MTRLHPNERIAWLDLLPLSIVGVSLFFQLGLVGSFLGFVLINLRFVLAPVYVVVLAHLGLFALVGSWPSVITLLGFEIGAVLLLARPVLDDPMPGRSVLSLVIGYIAIIGSVILLVSIIDDMTLLLLTLVVGLSLISYGIHRREVSRLSLEIESI